MASTDLTKAFHQVSVEAILTGARRAGFSSKFVRHIKDLYTNSSIILQFQGETLGVQPTTDVRQGDTLSPVLFNLVLDEYFTNVDPNIGCCSYASTIQDFFMPRGLRVNIKKSFMLSMQPSGREKKLKISTDNIFTVAGSPLPTSEVTTLWRYLGVTLSPQGTKNMGLRTQLQELLTRVSKAPLQPQQRLPQWQVQWEPHYAVSGTVMKPDLVAYKDADCVVLDAQIAGTTLGLPEEGQVWAAESAHDLKGLGFTDNDLKIMSVRCLQGGMACFRDPKKAQEEGCGQRAPPPPRNRAQRRRQLYEEHQRLHRLGPKVLVDKICMQGADPTTTLKELHRVYDPLMSTPSHQVDSITSKS
ncbi:reverse transcriptase, putative [Ixodes scapularis]|uniref:Reverse transcriptase, putative n=1 Tax=Ixodes scapularis TaxID=6945 RepID=B7QBI0_IXOSC|nr:reverse transcriptase, putative [Ixodes scapularis]|eukprot:XP_002412906.1 reverse transcriptase, putative [Ixodes scapularis]